MNFLSRVRTNFSDTYLASPPNGLDKSTRIFKSRDGNVYIFYRTPKGYMRAKLNVVNFEWIPFGEALNIGKFCGLVENEDGSIYIYTAKKTTFREAEKTETNRCDGSKYTPFDGTLTWRLGEYREFLEVQKLAAIDSDEFSHAVRATVLDAETISYTCGDSFADSEGKLHFFVGTYHGSIIHYLVGKDGRLSPAQMVKSCDSALRTPLIDNSPIIHLRNGKPDIFTGGEGGIYYYKFKKWEKDGTPVYGRDLRVRETNTNLYFGTLPMVDAVDWDGDGLTDIVIGNSQGQVGWSKNIGSEGNPKFAEPEIFTKEGEEFMQKGGYLNVQGPPEAQWGYVAPTAFDWDEDGRLDLVTGDNTSRYGVYFNKGIRQGTTDFTEKKELYCDSLEIHGTWRQRPGIAKLGNGKTAYVMLDWDDQLRLYWRLDKRNLVDAGKLLLVDGKPITGKGSKNGDCGRAKIVLADIDGNGKTDMLIGTTGSHTIPNPETGIPFNLKKGFVGASVLLLKNIGSEDKPVFEYPCLMTLKNPPPIEPIGKRWRTFLGWHSCSVDTVDFGGGLKGLIVGMEDGNIIFYKYSDIEWKPYDKLERRPKEK